MQNSANFSLNHYENTHPGVFAKVVLLIFLEEHAPDRSTSFMFRDWHNIAVVKSLDVIPSPHLGFTNSVSAQKG